MELTTIELIKALTDKLYKASEAIQKLDRSNLASLCQALLEVDAMYDQLKDLYEGIASIKNQLTSSILPDAFEAAKAEGFSYGGYNFSPTIKTRANIPADKADKGFAWLREKGYEVLIKETVNANSLSSTVSAHLEQFGEFPPDDAVSVYPQRSMSIRKK